LRKIVVTKRGREFRQCLGGFYGHIDLPRLPDLRKRSGSPQPLAIGFPAIALMLLWPPYWTA
jgi:hypothetical protein